ncbi:MAG: NUDIX hydrolase [Anaerolineae bacterium]|nr:NUDIX hydrolase [Anaerolineae bacterium]
MSYTYPYPRPALTVDIVLLRPGATGLEILLIQRGHPPFAGHWALPGGFVDENEPLETAALREMAEETGVHQANLYQVGAFGNPGRDPRGWTVSVAYLAWMNDDATIARAGDDAAAVRWWLTTDLPPLAFDHGDIIHSALQQFKSLAPVPLQTSAPPRQSPH